MEEQFKSPLVGYGMQNQELDTVAENAALADDRVLAELLRLEPFRTAIVGFSERGGSRALIEPSGAADGTVRVRPFRAVRGPWDTVANIGHKANWRDGRSALHVADVPDEQYRNVQLSATSSNNRWDLIWARVDVDQDTAQVLRYIKGSSGVVTAQNVVPTKATTVTLGVTEGTEAASPSRPSAPAHAPPSFYIPLAYVLLAHPHTAATTIAATQIHEVYAPAQLSEAVGARRVGPMSRAYHPSGYAEALDPWDTSGRPALHLPPSMHGSTSRFCKLEGLTSASQVLDDTIDWRNRWVKWIAQYNGPTASQKTWPTTITSSLSEVRHGLGNTIAANPIVVLADQAGSSSVELIWDGSAGITASVNANPSNGNLELAVSGGAIPAGTFLWLEATGQFSNV